MTISSRNDAALTQNPEPQILQDLRSVIWRASARSIDYPTLRGDIEEMTATLLDDFANGRVGTNSNTFEHRSRVLGQLRARLSALVQQRA